MRVSTHTRRLLHALKEVFGWDQKVQQALQCISLVTLLDGAKQLAEDSGCCGLKGWEKGRQGTLDGGFQGFWVLYIWKDSRQ